jgi:ATP-dependent Lon protease
VTSKRLPVLFLDDIVLLPGMVVPVELDEAAQAAVDAARTSAGSELLIAPRLEDRYASYGVVASLERVGKFRGGSPAAVLRTGVRARIGGGVTGPGAALWVEAEPVAAGTPSEHVRELAAEYKQLVVSVLQRREAWQVIDSVSAIDDPGDLADTAGWAPYLSNDR